MRRADAWLWACGGLLFVLTCVGVALPRPVPGVYGIGYGPALHEFVGLTVLQGVIYLAAVGILLRTRREINFLVILAVALLLRVPVIFVKPFLSSDIFRYVWDGWVQTAGINPYRYVPADAHLAFLRDQAVYPNINRADYAHTIYPPAAEMLFVAATRGAALLHIPAVLGMKLFMLACEGVGAWAMTRLLDVARLPRARILIYGWSPLPVWEFGNNGHVDAIAVAAVAVALLCAAQARFSRAAAALAVAALVKFLPVVILPALWRRWDWRFVAVFVGVAGLLYLPYLAVGRGVFGFLGGYGEQEGLLTGTGVFLLAALGFFVPLSALAVKMYFLGLAVVLFGLAAGVVFSGPATAKSICRHGALLGGVVMLGLSPHYPWYYAFLLVPACVAPAPCLLYITSFCFLLYLNPTHKDIFWPAVLYVPFVLLAARDIFAAREDSRIGLPLAEGQKI